MYIEFNEIYVLLIINHIFPVCPPGIGKLIPFFTGQWRCSGIKSKGAKTEVPTDVRNLKVRKQDKFRRDWSQH